MRTAILILLLLMGGLSPSMALARVGVGINLGKIEIDEPLRPGGIYRFPSIGVINTGDEPGEYELDITYHEDQPERAPPKEWFRFEPSTFHLDPGRSQTVSVTLTLPVKTKPGDYFAYLEAHPIIKKEAGTTTIGIAAATKTYFNVVPANLWHAFTHRITTFIESTKPASYVVLAVAAFALLMLVFRRLFSFRVTLKRK